jgi:hypothetical protein
LDDAKALTNPARPSLIASTIICLIALIGGFLVGLFYHEYIGWMLAGAFMWLSLLGFRSRSTGYAHPTIVALIIVTIVLVLAFGYGGVKGFTVGVRSGSMFG